MRINEQKLDEVLLDLGHDDFNWGTAHIREAVKLFEPGMLMTKELYPAIAKAHHGSPARIERRMRHALEKAWSRGSGEARLKYFGFSNSPEPGRPTVGEYVARLARLCRDEVQP